MSGSIIQMLVEIKNAALAKRGFVEVPNSKFRENLGKLLTKENFLTGAHLFKRGKFKYLRLDLPEVQVQSRYLPLRQIESFPNPGGGFIFLDHKSGNSFLRGGRTFCFRLPEV